MPDKDGVDSKLKCKLFIGGLDYNTTDESLKQYYEQWGTVIDYIVMKDPKTRRSRGFGFITYTDGSMVDEAMACLPHIVDGRQVDPKRAVPRDLCDKGDTNDKKLFVGGLSKTVERKDLEDYFSQFGAVTDCEVVLSKETGETRGFGFVEFDDVTAAEKVADMKGHELKGRHVDVKRAMSREQLRVSEKTVGRERGDRDDTRSSRPKGGVREGWNYNNWGAGGGGDGSGGGGFNYGWGGSWGGNMGGNPWNQWGGQGGYNMNPMMGGYGGGYTSGYGGTATGGGGYNGSGAAAGTAGGYSGSGGVGGYSGSGGVGGYSSAPAGGGYSSTPAGGGYGSSAGRGGGGPMRANNYTSAHRTAPYSTPTDVSGGGYGSRSNITNIATTGQYSQ